MEGEFQGDLAECDLWSKPHTLTPSQGVDATGLEPVPQAGLSSTCALTERDPRGPSSEGKGHVPLLPGIHLSSISLRDTPLPSRM